MSAKFRARRPSRPDPPSDPTNVAAVLGWARTSGVATRPHYLWGLMQAALTAEGLGHSGVSAIEFGVAGGNGLIALERAAEVVESLLPISVEVYGFDSGTGMPPPVDERDVPWLIEPGLFAMDVPALKTRLSRAALVLGPVAETVRAWQPREQAPVGFVAIDLDYYSATVSALSLFEASAEFFIPRVVCYFDDIFGFGWSDFNGERAAISDFNLEHQRRKIGKIPGLRWGLPPEDAGEPWPEQMYVAHLFDSPTYNALVRPVAGVWNEIHRLKPSD